MTLDITFSTRPVTFRECALAQSVGRGDIAALIELIVLRSDPPVPVDVVADLAYPDSDSVGRRLVESLKAAGEVDVILRAAFQDATPPIVDASEVERSA